MKKLALIPLVAACLSMPLAAQTADPVAEVEAQGDRTARVSQQIWDWAELGYLENRSSGLLQDELQSEGFQVEAGIADIPTAFLAEWGEGGPIIAILAEYDALPGISQTAAPTREQSEHGAGHACGHNLFAGGSLTAAIAVKRWLEKTGTPGRIRLYGTPAEEGGSGKVYMTRAGLFDDVDIALHWHAADENSAAARTSLANRSAKFRFRGISAHAAGAPERGRSALDGVEAMNMMVNMMREHTSMDTRIHYVITEGGSAPNVIPDFAEVFYYVRHSDAAEVQALWTRLEAAAKGAAMGTGTEVEWEVIHGNNPLLVNETLARAMDRKLRSLGGIEYTSEERAWAEEISKSFGENAEPLEEAGKVQPYAKTLGYGSTDVGDVSWATPTVGVRTATWVPGTSAHSWQAVAASGHSIGHKGAQLAAKALTLMAAELYTNEELRKAARAEFDAARGEDYEYVSLLGDRDPPLDYRE
ncbi:amidohydrolase [Qipengyuania nanhaisediminis]|uniref:Aminobenzoyl-glutamate utilization protein B n=1 Tax=Qipengyuania nanhaisediminis TaxID=604088 RepID=A0A1I5L3S3_9SPHN|nr:amidohydrolase [Qipengyuania nanhaisediminis]SFO91411.1 aminobenzoyl-glutamate utilization protein B [Qipengyuania nanhaisediminis]